VAFAILLASGHSAFAHHPMGGGKVTTFAQGLLSGLGHPILGADHLTFLLALGVAAAFVPAGVGVIAAFMIASFAGVVAHLAHVGLPFLEPALAVTVMAAGLFLIGQARSTLPLSILALVGGVLHGYALAESIVGVEPTPLAAYLAGLTVIQSTVMILAMLASRVAFQPREQSAQSRRPQRARWAGGAVCLTGAYFLAAAILNA
jgi:urease accessory protein